MKRRVKQSKGMIRGEIFSIEEVLNKIVPPCTRTKQALVDFGGNMIKMNSLRYQLFKEKGVTCCSCGLKGSYFVQEKHLEKERFHFNLYAIDSEGKEVLMTKDHIIPDSAGGQNHISNFQVMCQKCNTQKGNALIWSKS